ncbi:MAG: ATP-binding protein [Candidatus Makaraimicrobium thalassicum]|nr:MAG: ATP-binding protein [Candidatus Omnitrophota bacterium]
MKSKQDKARILLDHHLKALRLPVFLQERRKVAAQCASDQADYAEFLLRLSEQELLERERKGTQRRIRTARFPASKSIDDFDFQTTARLNQKQLLELMNCEWIDKCRNTVFLGNPGTGKTHLSIALGLSACRRGYNTRFFTAAGLVNTLVEARNERSLLRLQKQLAKIPLLIIDELGYVPFSKTGSELLFEIFSQRYEQGSIIVTSNLPFEEWTSVFQCERLTGALLDRLTHRGEIISIQGESYRLAQSKKRKKAAGAAGKE